MLSVGKSKGKATTRLWTQHHHLRIAIDQVDGGLIIIELESHHERGPRIVFANRGITELSGFSTEDLLGCPLAQVFGPEKLDVLLDRLYAVAESRGVFEFTNSLLCANCPPLLCNWRVSCVCDDNDEPINFMLTVSRIVEQRKVVCKQENFIDDRLSVEVIESDEQLRSARMEMLASLAGGIAHDFKNILTTIIANLSLARESINENSVRSKIDDALIASRNGTDMAAQLLAFAGGSDQGKRTETEVGKLLSEAARLSTAGSGTHCDVFVQEGIWSSEINVTQISQVINNLIINARHAMDDVGTIQTRLENVELTNFCVTGIGAGKYLRLKVIDHGCGMPPRMLSKIFEKFYTTKENGSGWGLATCQAVIREHGGIITVDSIERKTTVFTVFIPATGKITADSEEQGKGEIYRGVGSVLIVDDDQSILDVACAMLKRLGYKVESANSGSEGVSKYRRGRNNGSPFSVVLMDMTMPGGLHGKEATEQILEIDPNAKVISSSGYNFADSAKEENSQHLFAGVLSKPYDLEQVSRVFRQVIDPLNVSN